MLSSSRDEHLKWSTLYTISTMPMAQLVHQLPSDEQEDDDSFGIASISWVDGCITENNWIHVVSRIGHWLPIWKSIIGSSFQ
jgi:hypothetical protein